MVGVGVVAVVVALLMVVVMVVVQRPLQEGEGERRSQVHNS